MTTTNKATKFERPTQEQLQFYIKFCREHPELQAGKNCPQAPRLIQDLWNALGDYLNSMRGPTRTVAKWKDSLSHWKNQLLCRARAKTERKMTGGGSEAPDINDFELQVLQVFGPAAIDFFARSTSVRVTERH